MKTESIMAFSFGVQIGTVYSRLLGQATAGAFLPVISSSIFLLLCVLNPIYGYIPKNIRQYDILTVASSLVLCYAVPYLAVIPLGCVVALNCFEVFMEQGFSEVAKMVKLAGVTGFLVGRNHWVTDCIDFLGMLGPVYLLLESLGEGAELNPETMVRYDERIFTKRELLSLKIESSEIPQELQTLLQVPWRQMRKK